MKRKIITNTIYQLASKAIGTTFSLLLTIIITKNLGVYQFGELVKTISFVAIFYTPLDFGINAVILKLFKDNKNQISSLISQLNIFRLFLSLAIHSIIFIITLLLPSGLVDGYTPLVKQSIIILSFTLYIQSLIRTTNSIFQYRLVYKYTLATELIQNTVVLIATYISINSTKIITPIIYGYILGGGLAATLQFYFASKLVSIKIPRPDFTIIKRLIINSFPLGVVIIISAIHTKTDILFLTSLRPTIEVGIYGLVKRIFEIFLTIPLFYSNSLYPILIRKHSQKILGQSVINLFITSLAVIVFVHLLSPALPYIKPEFIHAIPLLKKISLTLPLFFVTAPLMWNLISKGSYYILIPIYTQALTINLILCYILIPKLGADGGIYSLAISELTTLLCLVYFNSKKHDLKHKQPYLYH